MTHSSDNRYKRLYSTKVVDGKSSPAKKSPDPTKEQQQNVKGQFKKRQSQG